MPDHVILGAGSIGATVARLLVDRGETVRIVTRGGSGPEHPLIDRVAADASDAARLTEVASDKAVKSQKPRAIEPGRYTTILEPRANARFLSLMTGLFNARGAEGPVGNYFSGKEPGTTKVGEKLFSDAFTLKSDIGNSTLRQTPIGVDGMAARPNAAAEADAEAERRRAFVEREQRLRASVAPVQTGGMTGSVAVDVRLGNAPPGTTATARTDGIATAAPPRVERAMQGNLN